MLFRLLMLFSLALCLGCGSKPPATTTAQVDGKPVQLKRVTLLLNWFPEAEHGGYYAAKEAGYYAQAGLDVEIIPGGPNVPVIQSIARGENMFGIAVADQILLGRAQEADVVALMSPLRDSPRCIMVHEESGITSLDQLQNVTLAMRTGIAFSEFLQSKVPLENVQVVPYPGNITQFLLDKKYAQQAYVFSEPFLAREAGAKPRTLMVSDLGYNPYTSLLFTRGSTCDNDPDVVLKMTQASQRGWQKYLEDPGPANKAINAANPEMKLEALEYGMAAIKPLCLPNDAPPESLGQMTPERWQTLAEQLVSINLLKPGAVKVEEAYRLNLLKQ